MKRKLKWIIISCISNTFRNFRLSEVGEMCGGPFFQGWDKILLLGEAVKFWIIAQKFPVKFLNNEKICRIFQNKTKISLKISFFRSSRDNKNYFNSAL